MHSHLADQLQMVMASGGWPYFHQINSRGLRLLVGPDFQQVNGSGLWFLVVPCSQWLIYPGECCFSCHMIHHLIAHVRVAYSDKLAQPVPSYGCRMLKLLKWRRMPSHGWASIPYNGMYSHFSVQKIGLCLLINRWWFLYDRTCLMQLLPDDNAGHYMYSYYFLTSTSDLSTIMQIINNQIIQYHLKQS